jgi:DNA-binding transcriptional MerR regulator
VTNDDPLTSLRSIPVERSRLDLAELDLIDRARRAGATWADIAAALGLASRQAAEQRRLRLATTVIRVRQQKLDEGAAAQVVALRAAVVDLDRRIGADRRWDRRFARAELVRMTLSAAAPAAPGGLFSLASDAMSDLSASTVPLPRPTRAAVDRLAAALRAATPTS